MPPCPPTSLLAAPLSTGVEAADALSDGLFAPLSSPSADGGYATLAPGGSATWDLGEVTPLRHLRVETADPVHLAASLDGSSWTDLGVVPGSGVFDVLSQPVTLDARYLRLQNAPDASAARVGELQAFCADTPDEPVFQLPPRTPIETWRFGVEPMAFALLAAVAPRHWSILLLAAVVGTREGWIRPSGYPLHLPELTHYYLGSKYASELGYTRLYACLVRAQLDAGRPMHPAQAVRDLRDDSVSDARTQVARCDTFSPERWVEFRGDTSALYGRLSPESRAALLMDHGYNPSPVWTLLGRPLAMLVPPTEWGLRLIALVDPALVLSVGLVVARVFGMEVAVTMGVIAAVGWPWEIAWTGGSMLRTMWISSLVGAAAALERKRDGVAGALVGLAASLRVFPVLFLVPALVVAAVDAARGRRPRSLGFLGGATAAIVGLNLVAAAATGTDTVAEFARNLAKHGAMIASNQVGVPALVESPVARGAVGLAVLALVVRRALVDWRTLALGVPLVLGLLRISSYYAVFCVLLAPLLAGRSRAAALVLLGGTWALSFVGTAEAYALTTLPLLVAAFLALGRGQSTT